MMPGQAHTPTTVLPENVRRREEEENLQAAGAVVMRRVCVRARASERWADSMAPRQSNADKEKREKEKDDVRKLLNTEKPKKVELGGLKPLNAGVRAILLAWRAV